MNHTPGPWSFHEVSRSNEFAIRDYGSSGGYAPIAIVKGDKRSTLAQSAANARLISAAPFLLEALAEMLVHCQDEERNDEPNESLNYRRRLDRQTRYRLPSLNRIGR